MVVHCIIGGDDYDSGPYSVALPPGSTNALFDIAIIFDELEEGNETFTLSIAPILPRLVSHGSIIQATVTIIDKTVIDGKYLQMLHYVYVMFIIKNEH